MPEESHALKSLTGYSPWGHKESDMTEQLTHTHTPSGVMQFEVGININRHKLLHLERISNIPPVTCLASQVFSSSIPHLKICSFQPEQLFCMGILGHIWTQLIHDEPHRQPPKPLKTIKCNVAGLATYRLLSWKMMLDLKYPCFSFMGN